MLLSYDGQVTVLARCSGGPLLAISSFAAALAHAVPAGEAPDTRTCLPTLTATDLKERVTEMCDQVVNLNHITSVTSPSLGRSLCMCAHKLAHTTCTHKCTQVLQRERVLTGNERAAKRQGLEFEAGKRGEGGAGSALTAAGHEKAAKRQGLEFEAGKRGEGGAGSALTAAGHEKAAKRQGLEFEAGKRGEGGAGSTKSLAASAAKLRAPPETLDPRQIAAARAQEKCDELNSEGKPGQWTYELYKGSASSKHTFVAKFKNPKLSSSLISFTAAKRL